MMRTGWGCPRARSSTTPTARTIPTTIVWLGDGDYPGDLRGLPIRVTDDRGVWDAAVADWKARHGL